MADDGGGSGKAASRRKTPGTTGRVTPKGTVPKAPQKGSGRGSASARSAGTKGPKPRDGAPEASARYTPPVPQAQKTSPRWVPILMFGLLALGVVIIIVNYLGVLPGGSDNLYLLLGLAAITGGFIAATQFR